MVTPQTNTTLSEIAERLKALDDFVICGHVNPDGDCLGAQLGLYHALKNSANKSPVFLLETNLLRLVCSFYQEANCLFPQVHVQ